VNNPEELRNDTDSGTQKHAKKKLHDDFCPNKIRIFHPVPEPGLPDDTSEIKQQMGSKLLRDIKPNKYITTIWRRFI